MRASSHEPGRTGCMARFTPEPFSPWVHMRNFSPVSEITLKRPKILGTSYGANFEKQRKHKNYREFASFIAMATLIAVSLQLNGMLITWKIQQAMGRCRPGRQNSSRFHPGNRAEVLIWPKIFKTLNEIPVGKTEISGTEPARPLI